MSRKRSMNYSNLPDATSISHGDLYVALQNISVYKSLSQARRRSNYHSTSEIFTVSINNILLLDNQYDITGNYRKCLLPMPGWIYFPQHNMNNSICYGIVAIHCHPLRSQQKKLEQEQDYKLNCLSRIISSEHIKKIILYFREHPWLPNLIILFIQAGIEILIFLDIILDLIVIFDLYDSPHQFWFALSCVILVAPYFIAWSVLFGFLQKNYKDKKIKCFTLLFTISPLGILILFINDIYHLIECVFLKPIHFIATCGRKLRSESFEELGYYKFRRVSEIFSESLCQALLQLWILLSLQKQLTVEVNPISVIMALLSTIFILFLWIIILYFESNKNGMTFVEYICVVFQGSFKFVPYLPAIIRGKPNGKKVNWIYFKITNGSIGTIANALISPLCQLQTVKLSNYSIRKVSRTECRYLGNVLKTSNVNLILSQKESHIKDLFDVFDISKSGSFNFEEFSRVILVLRSFRAFSKNNKLLYARIGNKRVENYIFNNDIDKTLFNKYKEIKEIKPIKRNNNLHLNNNNIVVSSSSDNTENTDNTDSDDGISVNYESESDEKRDRLNINDKRKDAEQEKEADAMLLRIAEEIRSETTWTDSVTNISIEELCNLYSILADKNHHKIWLLDLLLKVRTSTERLPCLDYDTPLYYAVKSNNIQLVSLLMAYGYHKKHRQEFEHCVIECIVTEHYKMALILCEHQGIPLVIHIRRGHHIQSVLNKPHKKHNSMNKTRDRSGLLIENEDNDTLNTNTFNPFVIVTVFEQTAQTDVIYNSHGSPLWNHYLLFIVPFDTIDEYILLKEHAVPFDSNEQLSDNPLVHIQQTQQTQSFKTTHYRSESLSIDSQNTLVMNKKIKSSENNDDIIGLPTHIEMSNNFSIQSIETQINRNNFKHNIILSPSRQHLRNMSVYSVGAMNDCNINIFTNHHIKYIFVLKFKLYHHDYTSFDTQRSPRKKKKKKWISSIEEDDDDGPGLVKSPKGFSSIFTESTTFGDIELGQTKQNLFNYQELIDEQKRDSTIKYTSNQLHNQNNNKISYDDDDQDADIDDDDDDDDDDDYKYIDKLSVSHLHNSYEKHFTTILNIKKRVFKGYRVKNACLDCKIHLSALKCYELFGLDYINKTKDEINEFDHDISGYDDCLIGTQSDDDNPH